MRLIGFLKMKRWAAHPPSERRVRLVIGVILACILLAAVEHFVGFPEIVEPGNVPRGRITLP